MGKVGFLEGGGMEWFGPSGEEGWEGLFGCIEV